jgi:DNA adenine methylase
MKLELGNCVKVLSTLDDASVDLLVTDPPYGISFMGKSWDQAVPSVEVWKQCLRVLKPGSFAFVMSLPRLDALSQMAIRLQEAGFRVDFTPIFWVYATGFPKAANISKAVDKRLGIFVEGELLPSTGDTLASASDLFTAFREKHATNPQSEQAKALEDALRPVAEEHSRAQLKHHRPVKFDDSKKLGDVRSLIADKLNVSTGYLTMLKQVVENRDRIPDVVERLERGQETVYSAYARLKNLTTSEESVRIYLGRYTGGKFRLARQIISRIPEHTCYVEPFGGFCTVLLNKPESRVEVYNDISKDVVNLMLSIKESPVELLSELELMPASRWLFEQLFLKLQEPFEIPDAKRVAIFYYVNLFTFGGLHDSGPSFVIDVSVNRSKVFRANVGSILLAANRLLNVHLENKPYQYILEHYDSEDTFFYCDPPYYETAFPLGLSFSHAQHKELRDRLMELKGGWLLTINDTPEVRELYKGCNIEEMAVMESLPNPRNTERKYYVNLFITPKNARAQ